MESRGPSVDSQSVLHRSPNTVAYLYHVSPKTVNLSADFRDDFNLLSGKTQPERFQILHVTHLLLKARCVRKDIRREPPPVTIVTGRRGDETRARYLGIFADVKLFEGDFGQFVDQKGGGIL